MTIKSEALREQANAELAKAKAILGTAEQAGRDMSAEEAEQFKAHFDAAAKLAEERKSALADEDVLAQAKSLADDLGLGSQAKDDLDAQASTSTGPQRSKSLGRLVVESAQFKSLLGQFQQDQYGNVRINEKARIESAPIPVKALITGTDAGSGGAFITPDQTGILELLGRRPLTIRDLVSVRNTASDAVEYVAQTAHTNNAAPVPEATTAAAGAAVGAGGYKPEGAWVFERRTSSVVTIAEWVPATKRALADVAQLEGLINDELQTDLAEAEEAQLVNGDGVGENLTGILNTSGIQTRAAADGLFATLRRALTDARIGGRVAPSGILVNPAQAEAIDLAREDGATGGFLGGGPFGTTGRTMWGTRVVESEAVPAGTALVGDFSKAVIWDRQQASVTMTDSHSDFFIRNLVAILAEERLAFAVTRPSAFVLVTGL